MTIELTRPAPTRARDVTRFVRTVLAISVLLTAAFVVAAAVLVPRIAGATPYAVLSGSMSPAYPPGTMVVVRPRADDAIGVGSVITFQLASGMPEVATHRVVAVARHPDGRVRFRTQGDANTGPDPQWVRPEQVRGALWYAVPHLGHLSGFLTGEQRRWGVQVVAFLLLGYAVTTVVGGRRKRT